MELFELVIQIMLGSISALVFIVILWDHIIDDRRLTKRVQSYYEDVENFIFSILEKSYFEVYKLSPDLSTSEKERSEKSYSSFSQKSIYYKNILLGEMIKYLIDIYSRYYCSYKIWPYGSGICCTRISLLF